MKRMHDAVEKNIFVSKHNIYNNKMFALFYTFLFFLNILIRNILIKLP